MNTQRTGGMLTFGILNIVFGSLGLLGSLLMILGGGLLAAGGAAMEAEMAGEAEGMGAMAAAGGGIFAIIGLVMAVCCALGIASGVGLIKVAPWGRTLTIVVSVGIIGLNLLGLFTAGLDLGGILSIAYATTLLVLCFSSTWKNIFANAAADQASSYAPVPTTSFAAIPAASGGQGFVTPVAAPMSMPGTPTASPSPVMNRQTSTPTPTPTPTPTHSGESNFATSGMPGMPGPASAPTPTREFSPQPDAPTQSNDTSFGGAGMPGIPAPPAADRGDDEISSAA
jgi:hypothetical protein